MKKNKLRSWIVAVIVIIVVVGFAILLGLFRTSSVAQQSREALSPEQMQALIPRGRELAMAGDCFGCHSQPQGRWAPAG